MDIKVEANTYTTWNYSLLATSPGVAIGTSNNAQSSLFFRGGKMALKWLQHADLKQAPDIQRVGDPLALSHIYMG